VADDQVTIDPEFDPRRPGSKVGQDRWLRWVGWAAIVAVASLSWFLLRSSAPTDSERGEEVTPVTTATVSEPTSSSTTTPVSTTAADDPGVVRAEYESADGLLGGLKTPNDVVFDPSGGLFVTETEARRVSRIEILADGSLGELEVVASGIDDAEGLALSDDGVLYVSGATAVYQVADGMAIPFVGGFADPEGLAIDADGDLYVADDAQSGIRITKVTVLPDGTAGTVTEVVIVPGESAADIDFGSTGELFVANSRDAVWVVEFADDGSARPRALATLYGQRALAFDQSGTLYVAGGDAGSVWLIEPDLPPIVVASGLDQVEGLALGAEGSLYISNVGTNEILQIDIAPIDASRAVANPSTTLPDVAGAVRGDDGRVRLQFGAVDENPAGPYLDFLYEFCEPVCFRDAVFVHPDDPTADPDMANQRFHVRHGFVNNSVEPLGEGFDVVMYLTRWSGPDLADGVFELGRTYRFTSDYVLRGSSDQCGPTYRIQTELQTCEWFVHDFPDGIPQGRYDLWAVWQAPCSAWLELAFTDRCDDPSEVISLFSSGVNSPFGWD